MADRSLEGRTVLIVEDEYLLASDLTRELEAAGARVLGPAPSVENARALAEGTDRIDAAVLDVNLGGEMIYPVAELLEARGAHLLFATGYDQPALPPRYAAAPHFEKPVDASAVVLALTRAVPPATAATAA